MIMTVAELRRYITTDEDDQALEGKLQALELLIRAYTNNNFQVRAFRAVAVAMADQNALFFGKAVPFGVGDTLQLTESDMMPNSLVTVTTLSDDHDAVTVNEPIFDESGVVVTKVVYPMDVKMGVVNMMKWELDNRDKVGIASESISRHSVTYFDMNGDNALMGFPKALLGFLKPYQKARFGRGIRV